MDQENGAKADVVSLPEFPRKPTECSESREAKELTLRTLAKTVESTRQDVRAVPEIILQNLFAQMEKMEKEREWQIERVKIEIMALIVFCWALLVLLLVGWK